MIKNTLIIALVIALIYLYYQQQQKPLTSIGTAETVSESKELAEDLEKHIQTIRTFLKEQLNSDDLEEIKTKLGDKTLNELLEENEDYETEVDTLTRAKDSLEKDLEAQSKAFQNRLREKDREVKKLKEDLNGEKQQHKGSLNRITKLTEQITSLEKEKQEKIPGETKFGQSQFPTQDDLTKEHQAQLRKINLLFDDNAKDYSEIDFNGLYSLLASIAEEQKKKKKTVEPIFSRQRKQKK
jgi:hypothetical protein